MHRFYRTLKGIAAVAVMCAVVMAGAAQRARAQAAGGQAAAGQAAAPAAQPQKKVKDQGEYDIFNNVLKDAGAQTWPKLLQDLDTWTQKYPESDYKDDRLLYYVKAYNGTNQPGKELDIAGQLLAKDLKTVVTDPTQVITVLYMTCVNIQKSSSPTPEQTASGEKAAHLLVDFVPTYFVAANKPKDTSDADWTKTGKDLGTFADATLRVIAMRPGMDLLQKYTASGNKDTSFCEPAEAALSKALQQFADGAIIAYNLGRAEYCQRQAKPVKAQIAIYHFARAAVVDPTLGGTADAKQIQDFLTKVYTGYHGSDEGFAALKELAAKAPFPPGDFKIETSTEIDARKEAEFKTKYPQLALWLGIKSQLADTNGEKYFDEQLKGSGVPKLKGVLMDAKPACRSKELLVAVPEPGQPGTPQSVITLKLVNEEEKADALTGQPETGASVEIQWEGVPSGFTKEPFMLTMDTEKGKITGLNLTPCAAAPVKKAAPKKSAPTPKKSAD